jgi:hypothetical protein
MEIVLKARALVQAIDRRADPQSALEGTPEAPLTAAAPDDGS